MSRGQNTMQRKSIKKMKKTFPGGALNSRPKTISLPHIAHILCYLMQEPVLLEKNNLYIETLYFINVLHGTFNDSHFIS
jgi:hypothetical protein